MKALPCLLFLALLLADCAGPGELGNPLPARLEKYVNHSGWEVHPPMGAEAQGLRRNLAPGDSVLWGDLLVGLIEMRAAETDHALDSVQVSLRSSDHRESIVIAEGMAVTRFGYRIAIVAAHTDQDELGGGKTEIEVARLADLPQRIRSSAIAGGPEMRLRIPHQIRMITLHHSGSAEPLRPEDDVPEKLRELQVWSETDRNWWDVPYHFLIGLDGTVYEGRDYRYRGETNTRYDVDGHLLISVLGNYEIQESTPEQIEAITELMAWAVNVFDIPMDHIYGHYQLAETSCPGKNLLKYLEDGTFRSGISRRLAASPG